VKQRFLVFDTLDDRREVYHLLKRLPPRRRVEWLERCCQLATLPNSKVRPGVSRKTWEDLPTVEREGGKRDEGQAVELFQNFWSLCANYTLDPDAALAMLVGMVRAT